MQCLALLRLPELDGERTAGKLLGSNVGLEPALVAPAPDFVIGKTEPVMIELFAQLFLSMRSKIDQHQPTSRT